MPGGHASHKGTSDKPNTNANDVMGSAADKTLDPKEVLREEVTANAAARANEFVDYPPAVQRPGEEAETGNEEE